MLQWLVAPRQPEHRHSFLAPKSFFHSVVHSDIEPTRRAGCSSWELLRLRVTRPVTGLNNCSN